MDNLLKILQISDIDVIDYVNDKIINLSSLKSNEETISLGDNGVIYYGWIDIDQTYLPSGNRSKGFKMTKQFYIDWCNYIREVFKKTDIKKISSNFDDYKLMKLINIYVAGIYFGTGYEESKRKEIYGHGNWKVIGETINIESIKNKGVARCIEKAAAFNGIANFMGIESSLILSEASLNDGEKIGHAYCMLRLNNEYLICDPNFYGTNDLGMGIPFVFSLNNQDTNKVVFNSTKFADKDPKIVEYYFPWHDFNDIKGKSRS